MFAFVVLSGGKNRLIPIVEKIFPLVDELYGVTNEFLLMVANKPILNVSNLRLQLWDKCPLIKGRLPHDVTSKVYTHKTQAQLLEAINRI